MGESVDLASVTAIEVVREGTGRKMIRPDEWAAHKVHGFVVCEDQPDPDKVLEARAAASAPEAAQEVDPSLNGLAIPEPTPEPDPLPLPASDEDEEG